MHPTSKQQRRQRISELQQQMRYAPMAERAQIQAQIDFWQRQPLA